jgi:outer membrane protein assembly factor BamB
MKRQFSSSLVIAALLAVTSAAADTNWPQFRGTNAGVADDPGLPDRWSTSDNVAWKTEIPGTGWSSPIVWGARIFITSAVAAGETETPKKGLYLGGERKAPNAEHRWMVYCVDFKTGRIRWEREAHKGTPGFSRHLKNSFASETPVTDGERVYAYFGNVGIFCYDLNGKAIWSKRFAPVKTRYGWGTAASPAIHKDRVYIVCDNDDQSFIVALNKKTGEEVWRVARDEASNWATPFVWENELRTEIVTPGTKRVRSYDLDGKVLWEFSGMSSIAIPTPFTRMGLLYVSSGYVMDSLRPVYAIKPGAAGDISIKEGEAANKYIAWHQRQAGPYNPSPLVYGDHYYTLLDRGFFTCHDARTGKEIYGKQRIDPGAGAFTSSPWAYNGKVFCLSEDGDTWVIQAGAEYKLLWKNSLDEMCLATPAIARGSLIIRTATKLYRIVKRA